MRRCLIPYIARGSCKDNFPTAGITQGNLRLNLPPNSLDSQQNDKVESWTDRKSSFP